MAFDSALTSAPETNQGLDHGENSQYKSLFHLFCWCFVLVDFDSFGLLSELTYEFFCIMK
jgi:hypothetical protein